MKIQVIQHALQVKKLRLWQVRRESSSPDSEQKTHHLQLAGAQGSIKKKTPTDSSAIVADPTIKELKRLSDFICCGICSRGGQREQVIKSQLIIKL